MRKPASIAAATFTDAELVVQAVAGSHEAFGEIVARYQTLVCSVTYSATGSLTQSEDLSQETFLTAWKQLRDLREPGRLRSWLCAIARNLTLRTRRDQLHEPSHAADSIDAVNEPPAGEAPVPAQAISREEEGIMWRSLERIPPNYREPLILFYRQNHSIERVAELLGISADTARQRLSRGRKLLQEEVALFVEGALRQSNPSAAFCASVMGALPLQTNLATGVAAVTKGGFASWASFPIAGLFASLLGSVGLVRLAGVPRVRRHMFRMLLGMWCDCIGLWIALALSQVLRKRQPWTDGTFALVHTACYLAWSMIMAVLVIVMWRRLLAMHKEMSQSGIPRRVGPPAKSAAIAAGLMTVGAFAWLVEVTWQAHDFGSLALTVASATVVISWILISPAWLRWKEYDPAGFAWAPALAITGVTLLLLNTRLDFWIAALRGTDLDGAHRFLPMVFVHSATAVLLMWIAVVVLFTRPRAQLHPPAP